MYDRQGVMPDTSSHNDISVLLDKVLNRINEGFVAEAEAELSHARVLLTALKHDASTSLLQGRLIYLDGRIAYKQSDLTRALYNYELASRYLAENWQGQDFLADVLNRIALIYADREQLDGAIQYFTQACNVARAAASFGRAALALTNLAYIAQVRDEPLEAEALQEAALLEASASLEPARLATAYQSAAMFAGSYGPYVQAQTYAFSAVALADQIPNLAQRSITLTEAAEVLRRAGKLSQARSAIRQAEQLLPNIKDNIRESTVLVGLAQVSASYFEFEAQLGYAQQAYRLSYSAASPDTNLNHVYSCRELIRAYLNQLRLSADATTASEHLQAAEQLLAEMTAIAGYKQGLPSYRRNNYLSRLAEVQALLAWRRENYSQADQQFQQAVTASGRVRVFEKAELSVQHADALCEWAKKQNNPVLLSRAVTTLQYAIKLYGQLGLHEQVEQYRASLATWELK